MVEAACLCRLDGAHLSLPNAILLMCCAPGVQPRYVECHKPCLNKVSKSREIHGNPVQKYSVNKMYIILYSNESFVSVYIIYILYSFSIYMSNQVAWANPPGSTPIQAHQPEQGGS